MIQSISSELLTIEAFLAFDDGTDTRYELVDGVLVEMPTESPENCQIVKRLFFELAKFFPIALLNPKDVELEVSGRRAKVRLPDLVVLSDEGYAAIADKSRNIITREMPPPVLVVEVVSPGSENRNRDYRYKRTEYAARGIAEYWIIDPEERQVTICQWVEGQYEDKIFKGDVRVELIVISAFDWTASQILAK
ncbi:MAG: Uma2 family endonuclease [Phormidium tanganyikae FI6-MK23]|jgi:Uma2 family endonuclease|nr:Uma2 family endonuclease [Phormidium tanganyikae FI6-MK23]